MTVAPLLRPCWSFTCDHDIADTEHPHAIVPQWLPSHETSCTDRPYELGSPCVVVTCDGCNTFFDGRCATYDGWHFATVERALAALADSSWSRDSNGRWRCPACPAIPVYAPLVA